MPERQDQRKLPARERAALIEQRLPFGVIRNDRLRFIAADIARGHHRAPAPHPAPKD